MVTERIDLEEKDEVFEFLNRLRSSGKFDTMATISKLQKEMCFTKNQAEVWLNKWATSQ